MDRILEKCLNLTPFEMFLIASGAEDEWVVQLREYHYLTHMGFNCWMNACAVIERASHD